MSDFTLIKNLTSCFLIIMCCISHSAFSSSFTDATGIYNEIETLKGKFTNHDSFSIIVDNQSTFKIRKIHESEDSSAYQKGEWSETFPTLLHSIDRARGAQHIGLGVSRNNAASPISLSGNRNDIVLGFENNDGELEKQYLVLTWWNSPLPGTTKYLYYVGTEDEIKTQFGYAEKYYLPHYYFFSKLANEGCIETPIVSKRWACGVFYGHEDQATYIGSDIYDFKSRCLEYFTVGDKCERQTGKILSHHGSNFDDLITIFDKKLIISGDFGKSPDRLKISISLAPQDFIKVQKNP